MTHPHDDPVAEPDADFTPDPDDDLVDRLAAIDEEEAHQRAQSLRSGLEAYELEEEDRALYAAALQLASEPIGAVEAMAWAVEKGIISGVGENTLAPQGNATRAQVVVMLHRYLAE